MGKRVAMLGAGSWGLATAFLLDANDHHVTMWEFDSTQYERLREHRALDDKLADFVLPESISITNDIQEAIDGASYIVLAIPSQVLRSVVKLMRTISPETGLVHLSKGIEAVTLKRMSEVIVEELDVDRSRIAILSGPSHAEEVVRSLPTTVVAAGTSEEYVSRIQQLFSSDFFRVYKSLDIVGVELGGALKNIIAIAAGIADGLEMGDNTRGAILTRGLAEITRLGTAMGARPETFAGLSGIGDLITTCTSLHSRNRHVGYSIGRGEKLSQILKRMTMVAEGVETTRSGYNLARKYRIEMPITAQIYRVLFEDVPAEEAVGSLMGRKLKSEIW